MSEITGKISLLVVCVPGHELEGQVSAMTCEEEVLWRFFAKPSDAYSLRVRAVVRLHAYIEAESGRQARNVALAMYQPLHKYAQDAQLNLEACLFSFCL